MEINIPTIEIIVIIFFAFTFRWAFRIGAAAVIGLLIKNSFKKGDKQ